MGELPRQLEIFRDVSKQLGDTQVRNMGTACGSMAHADPAGDWGPAAVAVGARLIVESVDGRREVMARNFFKGGPFSTDLRENEILVGVEVPFSEGQGTAYTKLKRKTDDFATVGAAVSVRVSRGGSIESATLVLAGAGEVPVAVEINDVVKGRTPDEAADEIKKVAGQAGEYQEDLRGSVEYKREMAGVMALRSLRSAYSRARGGD
ncbi:FAD binding domain-containing protein [Thermogymnomonas acidicola]|uniref:FAD binding domain-containing protein n=1 Tax=Thermogymnomonas acidicola TaxID=399579 RepID=UPI00094686F4|nr:FAD binding domain-containing protein [Thermogymnomonas acidicola]